jgi:hypothetical protein
MNRRREQEQQWWVEPADEPEDAGHSPSSPEEELGEPGEGRRSAQPCDGEILQRYS